MDLTRLKSWSALWLFLGLCIPALFALDFVVKKSESREVWLESHLEIQADGQDPLLLTTDLDGHIAAEGLQVSGADVLREARYPWRPVAVEGAFVLRLDREFLASTEQGVRRAGFAASYRIREIERSDGFSTPNVPCSGEIEILELALDPNATSMHGIRSAALKVDLVCTSAGRDLLWRTGDERGWIIQGTLSLTTGRRG